MRPVRVDVAVDAYVPADYVPLEAAKIDVHRRIALAQSADELRELVVELHDRFGPPPPPVENLVLIQEARLKLAPFGADYLTLRGGRVTIGKLDGGAVASSRDPRRAPPRALVGAQGAVDPAHRRGRHAASNGVRRWYGGARRAA